MTFGLPLFIGCLVLVGIAIGFAVSGCVGLLLAELYDEWRGENAADGGFIVFIVGILLTWSVYGLCVHLVEVLVL